MTTQTRTQTWGQQWEGQRSAGRRSVLDFDAWRPFFLTPRLIRAHGRGGRSWFVFGGVGLMLILIFVWAMFFWVVLMTTATWDFGVLVAYAVTVPCVRVVRKIRGRPAA